MSYDIEIKPELADKLRKLRKKNRLMYDRILKKIGEVSENPDHYKPLRHNMKGIRRVHLDPFVLIYSINEEEKVVEFLDVDHHDKIYI